MNPQNIASVNSAENLGYQNQEGLEIKNAFSDDISKECIKIVDFERTNWEEAVIYVTEKVGFRFRELIRILRKNYWGVFDEPIDKFTQREKVWIGLAQSTVETWVKNIDIDQKDVEFISRLPSGYGITDLVRFKVKDYLDRVYFGEVLDKDERQGCIDGTFVWKTWKDYSSGKAIAKRKTVDLLNIYIDPTEEDIQTAYRFTERGVMVASQMRGMTGWKNTSQENGTDLPGSQILNKVDGNRRANFGTKTTGNYRDVWEMWGKIPKWVITRDKNAVDAYNEIDGHIVVSGLEAPDPLLHLVEENKNKDKFGQTLKPYEEWRPAKVSGRWYGLGVVERLLALQEWLNIVVNIRINRSYVSQLGLFKIKKGKGITAQMLNRLPVNGGIQVSDMDDIEQMEMSEPGDSSYNDENVIKYWAQQVTSAMPISTGETLPSSTTATATATANVNAKSAYTMAKDATGSFLERWIDRHFLPILAESITMGDIIRVSEDDDSYEGIIEQVAINRVTAAIEDIDTTDVTTPPPTMMEVQMEIQKQIERLIQNPHLLIKNVHTIVAEALDTKVHVTNEDLDTGVTITNLIQMMQIAPELRQSIIPAVYDLMGLAMPKNSQIAPPPQQGTPAAPQSPGANTPQQLPANAAPLNG